MKITIFWVVIPCSLEEVVRFRAERAKSSKKPAINREYSAAYSSTLKMGAIR
jgi:hypothetical protein